MPEPQAPAPKTPTQPAGEQNGDGEPSSNGKAAPAKTTGNENQARPDVAVCRAFALGWQVSRLHLQATTDSRVQPDSKSRLPGLGALTKSEQTALGVAQVDAATHLLDDPLKAAGIATPSTAELHKSFSHGNTDDAVKAQVQIIHRRLLLALTAADFRLGKAYGLGRALADTCGSPPDLASLQRDLKLNRLLNLQEWLADLESAFPAHSARAVSLSLDQWRQWAENPMFRNERLDWPRHHEPLRRTLTRQGHLWRAVLSGEKSAVDMLSADDYLTAADRLLERTRTLVKSVLNRHRELAGAAVILIVFALILLLSKSDSTGKVLAGLAAAAGALGITWKGIGGALKATGMRLLPPLWGVELDFAVGAAITRLPGEAPVAIDRTNTTPVPPSGPQASGEAEPPAGS